MADVDASIAAAAAAAASLTSSAESKINTALGTAGQSAGVPANPIDGYTPGGFGVVDTVGSTPKSEAVQSNQDFNWNIFENIVPSIPFNPNNIDLHNGFNADYNTTLNDLEQWVRGMMTDWINTYFPTLDPALTTAEDSWLLNVVNNGADGISPTVEQAIWNRARAKDTIEAVRMEEEAISQFAARGFSLPPGALANRILQVQQEAANKSSTIARELAIEQMKIQIETVKFAISEISKLRLGIAAALADFIRAWMVLPQSAAEIARARADMQKILWNSSADYMRAQTSIAQLDLEAKKSNQATWLRATEINAASSNDAIARSTSAAISAADLLARQASAALGSQNSLVGSIATIASTA